MSRTHRRTRACASALAVLLIGACTVTTSSDERDTTRQTLAGFREQNAVRYDLTSPRSAQDLGVTEGRDSAIFDRDGSEFWNVAFELPGGSTFTTDKAIAVNVFVPDTAGGLLNSVGINVLVRDRKELAAVLQEAVAQLSIDQSDVQGFLADVELQPLSQQGSGITQVFDGRDVGYLSTSVEVRTSVETDRIAVNYSFTWTPGGAPTTSPSSSPAG